jgi:hypothetical protein
MGKYDSVFNSEETSTESLSPEEGVAAMAVITLLSDSEESDVDTDYLIDLLWETEFFDDYSDAQISEMVDKLLDIAEEEGLGALFKAAYDCLPDELLPDAFAAGVMMLVDEAGAIYTSKKSFLKELQQALELEDEEAQQIIDEVIATFDEAAKDEYDQEDDLDAKDESSLVVYESPDGNFSVPVPVDSQKGGRIEEQEGMVGFSDDFGRLLRIDYYPFSPEQADKLESVRQEDYLNSFLVDNYVEQAIITNIPNSKIEHREYLKDEMEGAYLAVVNMPQGSTISRKKNHEHLVRLDALRGLLAFLVDDFLYVVSCQRTFFDGETPALMEQEIEGLKKQLLEFIDTVEFT